MSALCFYVSGLNVATPLQGGGENSQAGDENIRLASLAICHPPDQNAETASVFDVFQSFDVDFWPLLKTEKVLPPSRFGGKFYFLPSILIYKLLFSRIPFISRKEWPILTAIVLIVKKIKGITNEKSFYLVIHFSR
jgi:hypothetical protein